MHGVNESHHPANEPAEETNHPASCTCLVLCVVPRMIYDIPYWPSL
jgi:hypothetical protein